MSLLSRLGGVATAGIKAVGGAIDSTLDAVASLDNDKDAVSFGDFLAFASGIASSGSSLIGNPGDIIHAFGIDAAGRKVASGAGATRRNVIEPVTSRIPEPVREVGKFGFDAFADPIKEGVHLMDSAYNAASRGVTTAVLASELRADRELQKTLKDKPFLEQLGYVNRLAWDAAKETSPGQAIMYAVLGGNHVDITDPETVGKILDSPLFDKGSGAIDASLRIFGDPTALALGGATHLAEARRIKQAAVFASESATAVGTAGEAAAGVDKLYDAFKAAKNPSEVRRRFFPSRNNQAAHIQSTALWDAAHMPDDLPTPRSSPGLGAKTEPSGLAPGSGLKAPSTEVDTGFEVINNAAAKPLPKVPRPGEVIDINPSSPSREKFNTLLRAMLGNEEAAGVLREADAAMAERVAFAQQLRNWAHPVFIDPSDPLYRVVTPDFTVGNPLQSVFEPTSLSATQRAQLDSVIEAMIPESIKAAREADLIGTLSATTRTLPRATASNAFRTQVVRSDFWQTSPLGRTLRVFADINPQRRINLHEPDFDVHVERLLTNVGLDVQTRDVWRTRALRSGGAGERRQIIAELDDVIIDHYAGKYGIDVEVLRDARDKARSQMDDMIRAAKYDTETETTMLRTINEAGEAEDYRLPLHPSQLENWAGLPDYKAIDEIAKGQAHAWTRRELLTAFADDKILNPFYRVWKPAVLLGIRTPTRIVGEEMVRSMSQIGAMTQLMGAGKNVTAKVGDRLGMTDEATRFLPGVARRPVTTPLGEAAPSLGADGVRNVYSGALDSSAGGVLQYGSMQDRVFEELADSMQNWKSLLGTDPGHMEAWLNDINKQIRGAPLAKRLLENGGDIEDAVRWLRRDPQGKVTMRANRLWARDPEGWAISVEDQIGRYLPTDELRAAAAKGGVTEEMLTAAFPDAATRPQVHGQMLAYTIGRDHVSKTILQKLDAFHQVTAVQPSIQLSRQPMFDAVYRNSIQNQARQAIKLGRREPWTMEELRQVERNAHRAAIGSVRETLYDMAEYSRFAEAFRYVAPFANATREVITTWAGIALHNPAFVRRIQIAWKAPEKAGWIYDSDGNQVHADGSATSPTGKKVKATEGRFIRTRFPDWAKDVPLLGRIVPDGDVLVNKDSLNTILANPYGTSPVVEVAAARLIDNAAMETQLKPFFPYGIERSLIKPFLPANVKQALIGAGVDDAARGRAAMQIYWSQVAEYEANGRQGDKPKMSDAMRAASHMAWVQVLAKTVLPASVRVATPMQPYIDIYKEMQRTDPEHAQENFLDKYGSEFAALTLSMSKSIDKVQPTLEAWKRRGQLADFIAKYPELGAVAVGEVSDPFNPAVYDKQKRSRVGGENYDPQRRAITINEAQESPGVTAGWYEFGRGMDAIEAERIRRKLPNLRVKAAEQLATAKQAFVAALAEKYPEWSAEYMKDDPAKYERRMAGMREIVQRLEGSGRRDVEYLGHYLTLRDTIEGMLSQRVARGRSGQLDSSSNRDLLLAWETGVGILNEKSPAFQRLWNRYLDHDAPRGHKAAA